MEENENTKANGRTIKELILYKLDRTLAIAGIIFLGSLALMTKDVASSPTVQVSLVAIGGLVTYVGGKVGK